jgi:hypothetical protein
MSVTSSDVRNVVISATVAATVALVANKLYEKLVTNSSETKSSPIVPSDASNIPSNSLTPIPSPPLLQSSSTHASRGSLR